MGPIDDVETYCENGVWKTRWRNSAKPFAAGGGKAASGQPRRNRGAVERRRPHHHQPDGTIAEHNSYRYRRTHSASPI